MSFLLKVNVHPSSAKAHHRCEGQGAFFEKTNFRKIVLLSWKVASPKKIESGKWLSGK